MVLHGFVSRNQKNMFFHKRKTVYSIEKLTGTQKNKKYGNLVEFLRVDVCMPCSRLLESLVLIIVTRLLLPWHFAMQPEVSVVCHEDTTATGLHRAPQGHREP